VLALVDEEVFAARLDKFTKLECWLQKLFGSFAVGSDPDAPSRDEEDCVELEVGLGVEPKREEEGGVLTLPPAGLEPVGTKREVLFEREDKPGFTPLPAEDAGLGLEGGLEKKLFAEGAEWKLSEEVVEGSNIDGEALGGLPDAPKKEVDDGAGAGSESRKLKPPALEAVEAVPLVEEGAAGGAV